MSDMFAFKLAKPAAAAEGDAPEYDPQRQSVVWKGGVPTLQASCTNQWWRWPEGRSNCNAYGTWCDRWGGGGSWFCD